MEKPANIIGFLRQNIHYPYFDVRCILSKVLIDFYTKLSFFTKQKI